MVAPTVTLPVTAAGSGYVATREAVEGSLQAVVNTLNDGIEENAADIVVLQGLVSEGVVTKAPVRVATTANGTLASAFENGDTVDGVVLATSDRILIKNQSSAAENGIYIVAASGAPTRATDADSEAELVNGAVLVLEGTANAGSRWILSTAAPITVGSTALTWQQIGIADPVIGEVTDAREGEADLLANLTAIRGLVTDAQTDATEALSIATIAGTSGRAVAPIDATNASARTVIYNDQALFERTYWRLRIYNDSGLQRGIKLRRFEDTGGANLTEVVGQTDVTVTVPAASPPQTVVLETLFTLEPGEYPGVVIENNAFTQISDSTGDSGGHYFTDGDVTTVAKSTLTTTVQMQLGIDFTEHAVEGYDYRDQRDAVTAHTVTLADLTEDLYDDVLVGNAGSFTTGTSLAAGSWAWREPATKRRRLTTFRTRNNTSAARSVTIRHAKIVGSNIVEVSGSTPVTVSIPAGPGETSHTIDFIQEIDEVILFTSTLAGWTTYISGVLGDEGGLVYAVGVVDTIPNTGDEFNDLRVMVALEGVEVAFDEVTGGGGESASAEVIVSLATTDLITFVGNSYTAGTGALADKSWTAKVSEDIDYAVETYGVQGTTVGSRISGIRANTAINSNPLGPQDYKPTHVFSAFSRNEAGASVTTANFQEDMRQLDETVVNGLGAIHHIVAEHADAWGSDGDAINTGTGDSMLIKSIARQLGAGFCSVYQTGQRLGRGPGDPNQWSGSHPGTRTNEIWANTVRDYIDTLPRPRQSIKFFRPRPGVSVSSAADLYFQDRYDRRRLWKEIGLTQVRLTNPQYYDNLDSFPLGQANTEVASERLALMAGSNVAFNGYALVYLVVAHIAKNITGAVFEMNDISADVLVPDGLIGTVANDTPVGAWVQIAEDDDGLFPISDAVLRRAMRGDVLPVMIRKSGAFNLTNACRLRYTPTGPEKAAPRIMDRRLRARGAEMLDNPTFPESGAPTGWDVTGGVEGDTTEDDVVDGSHLPAGAVGAVTVGVGKTIIDAVTYTEDPVNDREAQVLVVCRRKVAMFSSSSTYPDDAPITSDTFDLTKVRITQTDSTVGEVIAMQWLPVGVWWKECVFDVLIPAGTTTFDLTVSADADVEVVIVSMKTMDA